MSSNPRLHGRPYSLDTPDADLSELRDPNPKHIQLAAQAVMRLTLDNKDFEGALKVFAESDNAGMRHIAACDLCIDALKNHIFNPQPAVETER